MVWWRFEFGFRIGPVCLVRVLMVHVCMSFNQLGRKVRLRLLSLSLTLTLTSTSTSLTHPTPSSHPIHNSITYIFRTHVVPFQFTPNPNPHNHHTANPEPQIPNYQNKLRSARESSAYRWFGRRCCVLDTDGRG